jgi:hypothetical protein
MEVRPSMAPPWSRASRGHIFMETAIRRTGIGFA